MKIIKDLRILNRLGKKYSFIVDREYKYVLKEYATIKQEREMRIEGFSILYTSGCFYPYVCENKT